MSWRVTPDDDCDVAYCETLYHNDGKPFGMSNPLLGRRGRASCVLERQGSALRSRARLRGGRFRRRRRTPG
jgi:hypothetical protein